MRLFVSLTCVIILSYSAKSQNDILYYINAAKQNNPLINENTNFNKINIVEEARLKAIYTKPQIGLIANFLFAPIITTDAGKFPLELNSLGADKYFGYDLGGTNGGQYQAVAQITQPLFGESRFNIAKEQIAINSQINQNNSKITMHDVERNIIDQYLLSLVDLKQVQFAETMLQLIADQREILKKLAEATIYKQSDVALLNLEYQNFVALRANSQASYRRNVMDLNVLSGITDTALVILPELNLTLTTPTENSAYQEKYRLDSLNLRAQQNAFEIKYLPQANVFANGGLNATYFGDLYRRFGASAGFNFTYIISDGHQKTLNRDRNTILAQSIAFYREKFEAQNTLRKSKILTEIASFNERTAILDQQLNDYKTLLDLYKKEIVTGQISIVNYTTTIKNMALVQRDFNLLSAQKQSLINLYNYWNW